MKTNKASTKRSVCCRLGMRSTGPILPDKRVPKESGKAASAKVVVFVVLWYFASSLSNNTNKSIMSALPRPMLLTLAQLAFVFSFSALYLKLQNNFVLFTPKMLVQILPLAFANFFTHVLAYVALKDIAVSFINTIKVI